MNYLLMNCEIFYQFINKSSEVQEQVLKASTDAYSSNNRGKGEGRGQGKASGRRNREGRDFSMNFKANIDQSQGRSQDHDISKIECYRCLKFGHYASDSYTRLPNNKEKE